LAYCGTNDLTEWTDPSIIATKTKVRGIHLRELRKAVQEFHITTLGGDDGKRIIWNKNDNNCKDDQTTESGNYGIIDGTTTIKVSHATQLRQILDTYANLQGFDSFTWENEAATAGITKIRRPHIKRLREAVNITEQRGQLNCDACETSYEFDPCASACQTQAETNPCQTCESTIEGYECDSACQLSCQTTCQLCETCDQTGCESGCEVSCQSSCESSCQSDADWSGDYSDCGSCESACQVCESACETSCQTTCMTGCETSCENGCETGCEVYCQTSCETGCMTGCELSCELSCEIYCESACETNCMTTCETGCELACLDTCETGCEVSCESDWSGDYSDCGTCESNCENDWSADCDVWTGDLPGCSTDAVG